MAVFCTLRKQRMILELDVTVFYSLEYVHYIVEKNNHLYIENN